MTFFIKTKNCSYIMYIVKFVYMMKRSFFEKIDFKSSNVFCIHTLFQQHNSLRRKAVWICVELSMGTCTLKISWDSFARVGYFILVLDFYLVLHGLCCQKKAL